MSTRSSPPSSGQDPRSASKDPELAEKLIPKDYGSGAPGCRWRASYYEAYNRPNVHWWTCRRRRSSASRRPGIRTTADGGHEFDVIVYATGFDAVTGAYDRIDIRGGDGRALRDKWADGPVMFLGLQVNGFPNIIMPTGPAERIGVDELPARDRDRGRLGHRVAPSTCG